VTSYFLKRFKFFRFIIPEFFLKYSAGKKELLEKFKIQFIK